MPKKAVREAMRKAKELEKLPLPSREEIAKTYRMGMDEARKLQKLLKPEWFVKDVHRRKTVGSPNAFGDAHPKGKRRKKAKK